VKFREGISKQVVVQGGLVKFPLFIIIDMYTQKKEHLN
jgi:hypothetical protein